MDSTVEEFKVVVDLSKDWEAMEKAVQIDDKIELWSSVSNLVMKLHANKNLFNKVCGYGTGEEIEEHLKLAEEAFSEVNAFKDWLDQLIDLCQEHHILLDIGG
jgi:hypothetical protein